jgi:hypothetical protein
MARYKDGLRIATNLFEAAAWHKAVKPVCKCTRWATFNPHALWWHFHCKGWNDNLVAARAHFWCRNCADRVGIVRPIRIDLTEESTRDIYLTLPPEAEWKRALNRFRS